MQEDGRRTLEDVQAELNIFDGVRTADGPVQPVRLRAEDEFQFRCHPGVSCWNRCCHGADITITPYDVLSLSRHLGLKASDFLATYTVPATLEASMLPVAKLKMGGEDGGGPCPFMREEGCSVYPARPVTCRYYPLGLATFKLKDTDTVEDFNFLVRESHCQGHSESRTLSVGAYRHEQGVEDYDRVNRGWMDILMKMASWKALGGPWGQEPQAQTKQMFFLVSTDVEGFRRFVFGTKFLEAYEIDPEAVEVLRANDEELIRLGFDWMKNVLFNEQTLTLRQDVLQRSIAKARNDLGAT